MIKDISAIKIGPVWNGGRGATFKDEIDATPNLSAQIKLLSPITADLMMIRMKEGVSVVLSNWHTSAELPCARCLEKYKQAIDIKQLEVHFFSATAKDQLGDSDQLLINVKDLTIDLTEAIRQEIILHFPMIPVCSKRCKGLCQVCQVNLNKEAHRKNCNLAETEAIISTEEGIIRPFANLKDLFKN